ncbi:hypothetical protein [Kribbella sp. NBC_00889]|uniref:hypothetical protein n=1 Tax=Kribbella sp. NBC_00889 TaxID=2975974 RepID=UPI0038662F29|nr:hypothetical protein OG817_13795 [Kribbella sp. NBC_00889]
MRRARPSAGVGSRPSYFNASSPPWVGFAEFEVHADAERSTVGVGAVGDGDLELLS